jgi:hypothetical protein
MSTDTAKDKFKVLFDVITVSAFSRAIGGGEPSIYSKQDNKKRPDLKKKFLGRLGSLCGGQERGLDAYLMNSIEYSEIQDDENPDSAIDYVYIADSRSKVCAILIAHRGECVEVPGWWIVRLICNRQGDESCRGQAGRLLGLYMYALKTKSVQPCGLLEVANDYRNIPGYCLYTRFGFEETNIKCFAFVWMAMASELARITTKQIIDTTVNGKLQIAPTGATRYCDELKKAALLRREPLPRSDFTTGRLTNRVEYTEPSLSDGCIIL